MKISFHGAARGVTGSCHLVETRGLRVLVDCGLYQGGRDIEEENARPFGFDPRDIDVVLLTHAHLDHCGRLPMLVRQGFRGEIVATAATRDLARLVLLDAAHLQEEELVHRVHRAHRRHAREDLSEPLYSVADALQTLERFVHPAPYGRPVALPGGARATFLDAGHILGSASVLLEIGDGSSRRALLFSGDLGNSGRPLLRDPAPPPDADVVVMETTYGNRDHRSLASSVDELHGAIAATFARGGNVIIPTFALERAQELLFHIRQGVEHARIPAGTHVFLDSPMAISATDIFRHHPECYDEETRELFRMRDDPFAIPNLHFTRESSESMAINRIVSGAIILAGSGMCTGGRVRHHLRHQLGEERCAVIFVGLCRRRHARAADHRRRHDGAHPRRGHPRARPHPHHQRLLRACRAIRAARVARAYGASAAHVPGARRGGGDDGLRGTPARRPPNAATSRRVYGLASTRLSLITVNRGSIAPRRLGYADITAMVREMRALQRQQTQQLRSNLLAERERILARARDDIAQLNEHPLSEIAGDVPDEGDESVAVSVCDFENAMIRRELAQVREIDSTLQRIESRGFGLCVDCGEPIAKARLAASPTATRCIECQKLHERTYAHAAMPTL